MNKQAKELTPFERWMVRSNLATIAKGEQSRSEIVAILRSGGYDRIADAVDQAARIESLAGVNIQPENR